MVDFKKFTIRKNLQWQNRFLKVLEQKELTKNEKLIEQIAELLPDVKDASTTEYPNKIKEIISTLNLDIDFEKDITTPLLDSLAQIQAEQDCYKQAKQIVEHKDPYKFLIETVGKIHVGDKEVIALLIASGCSSGQKDRKQRINVNCVGRSGKGKSTSQDHTGLIFSKYDRSTSSSKKSIIYQADAEQLQHGGIIQLDEATMDSEDLAFERTLTDNANHPPIHKTVDTSRKYKEIILIEVNAIWRNSVDSPKDDQLLNRYITVNVDESVEQDNAVYKKQIDQLCYNESFDPKKNIDFVTSKVITNIIKEVPCKIAIPFGELIESTDKRNRRSLPKFLLLLRAIVYIYRFQRIKINGILLATKKDFELARAIWNKAGELEGVQVTEKELELLKLLPDKEENAIGRAEPANKLKISIDTANNYLKTLIDKGIVNYKKLDNMNKYVYWTTKNFEELIYSISWEKFTISSLKEAIKKITKNTKSENSTDLLKLDYEQIYNAIITVPDISFLSSENTDDKNLKTDSQSSSQLILDVEQDKSKIQKRNQIIDFVKSNDKGEGIDIATVCNNSENPQWTRERINELIIEGELVEIKPDILKVVT